MTDPMAITVFNTKNPGVNFCLFVYADPNHALHLPSCRKNIMDVTYKIN